MTAFDDVAPTQGDNGNSFEWIWDIATDKVTPAFLNVPDMTGLNPSAPPKQKDDTTYANKGQTSQSKTGEDWTMQVQVKGVKDETGEFQPELVALIEAADASGDDNVLAYRYYHATSRVLAYQGTAGVEWTRANTDNDSIEFFSFTLTGKGDRRKIANPAIAPATPVLASALPSGAAAGSLVTITGTGLTGATAVKVGGVSVDPANFAVTDGGTKVSAVVPAGSAGSAPITVTTPAGNSNALPYTRGA